MDKKEYADFLQSMEWKAVRNEYIKTHSKCVMCGRPASEVHHFKYEKGELGYLNTKNLVSLCRSCHREVHLFDKLVDKFKGDNLVIPNIISSFHYHIDSLYIDELDEKMNVLHPKYVLAHEEARGEYMYRLFWYAPSARRHLVALISLSSYPVSFEIKQYLRKMGFSDILESVATFETHLAVNETENENDPEPEVINVSESGDERSNDNGTT